METNVKDEFIAHTNSVDSTILCCEIKKDLYLREFNDDVIAILTTGYTTEEYKEFLQKLDYRYNSGYGGQELFGTIWYKDGSWSCRGEYDGSEWWQHQTCPIIPNHINRVDKIREEKLNQILYT